jgi:hypothetical protein
LSIVEVTAKVKFGVEESGRDVHLSAEFYYISDQHLLFSITNEEGFGDVGSTFIVDLRLLQTVET